MSIDDLTKIPQRPWGWVLLVVVVLLLWEGGKRWVPTLVEWLARRVRAALAGTRVMHGRALRTYRQKVVARYARLPVLLLTPGEEIDMSTVYVPLQAVGDRGTPAEAYDQIKATDHAVVLGRPGAGKTMLLRHSMLTWGRDPSWRRDQRVPVLLELTRCGASLEESIVRQLAEDGFPKAGGFVARALRDGKLSVLFDGLDEVSAAERFRVVSSLRSFAAQYAKCQIVVTCRTAIYQQQLAPEITTSFQVAEFDDHHIRRFLRQWPDIPDDAGVERLMSALRDAPRIMQLARNPLLLTMIANLYGGRSSAETVLPHSRAEFYKEAVDALLSRLKGSQNQFKGPVKRAVLVRLAAAIQNTAATSSDRRTRRYEDVLSEVLPMKESLNIADVEGVLDEIIDRSGLLLRIDGGMRYQFAHLSLQEYLAAVAYEQDPHGLLAKYQAAPGDWREVVKLWCGVVSTDSASLIESVFKVDKLLAFECLADAQVVSPTTADRIIRHFQGELLTASPEDAAIIAAFGLVAGDPRPRGRRVFRHLTQLVENPVAHMALAATKLPEAAEVLAGQLDKPSARGSLVTMGDLAVPALSRVSTTAPGAVVKALGTIGTPAAAVALTRILAVQIATSRRDAIATRAAWYLAALIEDPEVEAALCGAELPEPPASHAWIWAPFSSPDHVQTSRVAGWVAFLCDNGNPADIPSSIQRIDPRLAIPLFVFNEETDIVRLLRPRVKDSLPDPRLVHRELPPMMRLTRDEETSATIHRLDAIVDETLAAQSTSRINLLYRALDDALRTNLIIRWIELREPVRRQNWQHVRDTVSAYKYFGSPQHWFTVVTYGLFSLVAIAGAGVLLFHGWPWGPAWFGWGLELAAGAWFAFILSLDIAEYNGERAESYFIFLFAGYLPYFAIRARDLESMVAYSVASLGAGVAITVPLLAGAHYLGWPSSIGLTLLTAAIAGGLTWYGERRERAARNIFIGLLELDETAPRRTSVIAN